MMSFKGFSFKQNTDNEEDRRLDTDYPLALEPNQVLLDEKRVIIVKLQQYKGEYKETHV